jgi:adenylyltransferase/sulfurtransferase
MDPLMDPPGDPAESLRLRIENLEAEMRHLKEELRKTEVPAPNPPTTTPSWKWPLSADEYDRYQRQLILSQVGVQGMIFATDLNLNLHVTNTFAGQLRLKTASVLIVGVGGLGCPAAAYLAGAGVGTIGLADGDKVEISNLHRQIIHSVERVGMNKADSAICYLRRYVPSSPASPGYQDVHLHDRLNPSLTYRPHNVHLDASTAADIIAQYDLVLDCTDHPTSRYLVSDACVLLRKPLIFASALRTHGQLMVMNHPARPQGDPHGGPCYRCIFPAPSPPDTVISCGEGGILGPVVGVMGVMQALKAINIITDPKFRDPDQTTEEVESPSLLLLSGHVATPFRSSMMRKRRPACYACGGDSELTLESLRAGKFDYVHFCGVVPPVNLLQPEERISPGEYQKRSHEKHVLLDVREREHFNLANLVGAINIPFSELRSMSSSVPSNMESESMDSSGEKSRNDNLPEWFPEHVPHTAPIYVVCRQGEDSQVVTRKLKEMGLDWGGERFVGDITGGMRAWREEVDETFPFA